jgi:sentrin-specific protease 7
MFNYIFQNNPIYGEAPIDVILEDYECLQGKKWLNDTIIDFCLQNLKMSLKEKDRIHIFSTQFFTHLTSKLTEYEVNSGKSQAQIRFERVKNWTKNINLFVKDFVVVPINETHHWFAAVICSLESE